MTASETANQDRNPYDFRGRVERAIRDAEKIIEVAREELAFLDAHPELEARCDLMRQYCEIRDRRWNVDRESVALDRLFRACSLNQPITNMPAVTRAV